MLLSYLCRTICYTLFFFITISANGQIHCDSAFKNKYNSPGNLEPYYTLYLPTRETLIAGTGTVTINSDHRALALKLSLSGKIIWSFLYGNTNDVFTGATQLADGSYLFWGTTSPPGEATQVLLVNITAGGQVIWTRQLHNGGTESSIIKSITQYTDGDIIGTLNVNDSTPLSHPVVFKMGLNGTLKWARKFEAPGAQSFTSLAFQHDTIFVSGFVNDTRNKAILTMINANDGQLLTALNIYHPDDTFEQEMIGLEVADNKITYGITLRRPGNPTYNQTRFLRTDMHGNLQFKYTMPNEIDTIVYTKRSPGNKIMMMETQAGGTTYEQIFKTDNFGLQEWHTSQGEFGWNVTRQINKGFDITPEGGSISAGYYTDYSNYPLLKQRMIITKVGESGAHGNCTEFSTQIGGFFDTISIRSQAFAWASTTNAAFSKNILINIQRELLTITTEVICDTVYCVNSTPLPPGCNKTSLVEYNMTRSSTLRDVITTSDGDMISVGGLYFTGMIVKTRENGDVIWAKHLSNDGYMMFYRIISSGDDFLIFGIENTEINGVVHGGTKILKIDKNGNVLFDKLVEVGFEVADVSATPDGGFVIITNGAVGVGYTYSGVIRFKANCDIVWSKEIKHSSLSPIYRSVICSKGYVYMAHDMYAHKNFIGMEKLELSTGTEVWNKLYDLPGGDIQYDRLLIVDDTLYNFMRNQPDPGIYVRNTVLMKTSTDGNIISAINIDGNRFNDVIAYSYIDESRPSVIVTPQKDFILSGQVIASGSPRLNLTKLARNGNIIWSKNYPGLSSHVPYSADAQGNNMLMVGVKQYIHGNGFKLRNNFILKVDSAGNITNNAIGTCVNQSVTATLQSKILEFMVTPSGIDSVVNLSQGNTMDINYREEALDMDAELYCRTVSTCAPVQLTSGGGGCSMQDTLVYYLAGNSYSAAATWEYDTAFVKPIFIGSDTIKFLPVKSGTSILQVRIEDDCTVRYKQANISVLLSASSVTLGKDTLLCTGATLMLNAGAGYVNYTWNNNSHASSLTVNIPGLYWVEVTDQCGGKHRDSVIVSSANDVFELMGAIVKCNKDTIILSASPGFYDYKWSPATALTAMGNTAKVYPEQTTKYYVQAELQPGCIVMDSLIVTVKTSPNISLGTDVPICFSNPVTLQAQAGFISYEWSTGAITSGITVSIPGTYTLAATYNNGCISRDTIVVTRFPFIYPNLGKDTSLCSGPGAVLKVGNYAKYEWSTGTLNTSSITVSQPGTYWVKVTDSHNCTASDTVRILNVYSAPSNFLSPDLTICPGQEKLLIPMQNFRQYLWQNGSSAQSLRATTTGLYVLQVLDQNNCAGKDSVRILPGNDCPNTIWFQSAFTPNADGKNDTYKPIITGYLQGYQMVIYDRYGEIIYTSVDPAKGWDGRFRGDILPMGSYVYTCRYKFAGLNEVMQKGTIMLIR